MGFQREVSGVEQVEFAVGEVAAERFRARGAEDFVVLAPGDEQRWLVGAEVLLKRGVPVEVELVVPEQLQLDGVVVLAVQAELVELPGLGRDAVEPIGGYAVGVLPVRGFGGELFADAVLVGGAVLGVGEQDVPERGEAFQVGVAALGDQRGDPFGAPAGDPQADRGAVVVDVEGEALEAEVIRSGLR